MPNGLVLSAIVVVIIVVIVVIWLLMSDSTPEQPKLVTPVLAPPLIAPLPAAPLPAAPKPVLPAPKNCLVTVPSCPNQPQVKSAPFFSAFNNSDNDPSRCANRAQEFYNWCGRPANTVVTSKWVPTGKVTRSVA